MKTGITGHQHFSSAQIEIWIKDSIEKEIKERGVTHGYTSLAIGADQMFAEVLNKVHIKYSVIIPCDNYYETFNELNIAQYERLVERASQIIKLPYIEPSEQAFYDAGKKIVELSDIIFAVWDGQKAKGLGGTGDVVKYAQDIKKTIIHFNPLTKIIQTYHG